MDEATTSSLVSRERGRGAGGKFRKPAVHRSHPTPYDRPPSSAAVVADSASQSIAARRKDVGWFSKIVDPACRLISNGATRIFPSFFSIHRTPDVPADSDPQDYDLRQDVSDAGPRDTENFEMPTSSRLADPVKEADRHQLGCELNVHDQNQESNSIKDDGLCEIEQMLKGKKLSREEVGHLIKILHSNAADLSNDNKGKKIATMGGSEQPKGFVRAQETQRMSVEEKSADLNGSIWRSLTPKPSLHDVGASPDEIARAYMENQTPHGWIGSKGVILKDGAALLKNNESALKASPLPSSKSSTCWPGAVLQDQGSSLAPASQSSRSGLHNFPRTPYSGTIYSKSKIKLLQSQIDGGRYPDSPSSPFQQFRTSANGWAKSRGDALNGSAGPVRTSRNNLVTQTPRGSVPVFASKNDPSQRGNSKDSGSSLPFSKNNWELESPSRTSRTQPVDNAVPRSSESGMLLARRISERIDRNKPTPKEKLAELNLSARFNKSDSYKTATLFVPEIPLHSQSNGQFPGNNLNLPNSAQPQSVRAKRGLGSISIDNSDSGFNFTFPIASPSSGVAPEPPTPSVMPSPPSVGLHRPERDGASPSYMFGTKNPPLAFSFPPTGSSSSSHGIDEPGLVFNIGSDKARLCFNPVGKSGFGC